MIRQQRVEVDGSPAFIGQKVDPEVARVTVDGIPLPVRPGNVYYLVFKPPGIISSRSDDRGRPVVTDLVPSEPPVYPVGRLDADSEGLLILTNDGDLTNYLTHPRFGVTKTYTVLVQGQVSKAGMRALEEGIELDDGPARAVSARIVDVGAQDTLLELVMADGRNREVRRMIAALDHSVLRLVRTAIADLRDRDLRPGTWRRLTPQEVRRLYAAGTRSANPQPCDNATDQERKEV